MTVSVTKEYVGCETVTVGESTIFESTSDVAFRAGIEIRFENGVVFETGSTARIEIDPTLIP